jgi:hypothetical protein
MFRALLAQPQEALHRRYLVYCVRVMSVSCYQDWSGANARKILSAACVASPEDEQVMIETSRGP